MRDLQLKGLRPKTIEACARAMRRIGAHFDYQVSAMTQVQLADYFTQLMAAHSWSGVKLHLCPGACSARATSASCTTTAAACCSCCS